MACLINSSSQFVSFVSFTNLSAAPAFTQACDNSVEWCVVRVISRVTRALDASRGHALSRFSPEDSTATCPHLVYQAIMTDFVKRLPPVK